MRENIQRWRRFSIRDLGRAVQYLRAQFILPLFADVLIISHPKAGRTWVRFILNVVFNKLLGRQELYFKNVWTVSYEFFEMSRKNDRIPKILFTHLRSDELYWLKPRDKVRCIEDKKIVLLVRDPRDIMVSNYFQLTKRVKSQAVSEKSLSEFVRSEYLDNLLNFMNTMEGFRYDHKEALLLKYEDLQRDTIAEIKRLIDFLEIEVSDDVLEEAVAYGSFANMQEIERGGFFAPKKKERWAGILETWDTDDRDAYKVRRGKVGGYMDYLSDSDVAYLDSAIEKGLSSSLEYG
ncbi:MAG: sulfotransferase domain-containing protein [Candidatus Aminicenantes bacterium]